MPDDLHCDFETFSLINLKDVQLSRYVRHPSTTVLMCAYALNDGAVQQWVPAEGRKMPADLKEAWADPQVRKHAFNAQFEMGVIRHVLKLKVDVRQWRCVQVLAMSLALPQSLEKAGDVVNLPLDQKKVSQAKTLIRLFSLPRKPTKHKPWARSSYLTDPEKWEEYKQYNRQDVVAERALYRRLRRWDLPDHEWELWFFDQLVNENGFPVNMRCVDNAIRINDDLRADRLKEMADITGLENPNSGTAQLLPWLKEREYPFADLKKGHIQQELEYTKKRCERPHSIELRDYKRVLELRQEVSKTSVMKYEALERITDDDGFYRYAHQFCGAGRTWRWAGRGFQVHNLLRPIDYLIPHQAQCVRDLEFLDARMFQFLWKHPFDVLATCVRPVIQAPEGKVFVDADLNAIENRVLGWMANDRRILEVFAKGLDPYIAFAVYMYEMEYKVLWAEYKSGNKAKRQDCKPPVLGCGYMLSAGEEKENPDTGEIEASGLLGYAWNMGIRITLEQSQRAVKIWRSTHTDAVSFWKAIDKAARKCIRTGERTYCEMFEFDMSGPFMRMKLPSGRYLHYCRPKLEDRKMPWGETRLSITYENLNDKNQWVRVQTHPGKLTENGDQAIARDLLAHGMMLAYRRGVDIRIHVHDQAVGLADEDEAEKKLAILVDSMKQNPPWARDLPLDAAGSIGKLFLKD